MVDRSGQALRALPRTRPPERRAHPRVAAELGASCEDRARQVFLRTADVSEGGVWLRCPDAPPPGSPATVLLELPEDPVIHRFRGTAVWRRRGPDGGFAVRFDASERGGAGFAALRRFVARALSTEPE